MVPEVKKCTVEKCYYWKDGACVAHAITVGSDEPVCETYIHERSHSSKHGHGEVGACHVGQCVFNDELYCRACDDVEIGWEDGKAVCETFKQD